LAGKRVTSKDVADHAGVSRTTVSFVLNKVDGVQISAETRKRVFESAQELGYVPYAAAQSLASGRSKVIGLILSRSSRHIASDAYLTQILDGLTTQCHRYGMQLLLEIAENDHSPDRYLNLVSSKRIDGIIFSGPREDDLALQRLYDDGFPTVLMGKLPNTQFCYVDIDNQTASFNAVKHLIDHGHNKIACITNASLSYHAANERLQGYKQALSVSGIDVNDNYIRYGDFDPESGYFQMENLLKNGSKPSAVFVASDVVALGAMTSIREHGLSIPKDIALVGFDDVLMAKYVDPPLTTIRLPVLKMAQIAIDMVVQLINGNEPDDSQVLLDTEMIIRQSSFLKMEVDK